MTGEECPYCGYDELSSHYHCGNCGTETGMFGHWNGFDGFTCVKSEEWAVLVEEVELRDEENA